MVITYTLAATIVGLIVWFVPFKNGKINEAGKILFTIGLLWLLYASINKAVHLS